MLKLNAKPFLKASVFKICLLAIVLISALLYISLDEAYAKPEFGSDCASCHNGTAAPKLGGGAEPAKENPTEPEKKAPDKSPSPEQKQAKPTSKPANAEQGSKQTKPAEQASAKSDSTGEVPAESTPAEPVQAKAPDNNTCLACHGKEGFKGKVGNQEISLAVNLAEFKDSVHGGNQCVTCHENTKVIPHEALGSVEEIKSTVSQSCLKCHANQATAMNSSVHSKVNGLTCVDCHGSHDIKRISENPASLSKANLNATCTSCHQGKVLDSYKRSFHGIALAHGYEKAAACTDCHGTHSILPASNPESKISAANLANTCDSCHPGMSAAGANLVKGKEHVVPEDKEGAFPLWITWKIFLALILFDVLMNGTIPTLELLKLLRGLFRPVKPSLDSPDKDLTL
ncbi:cytochrome c3 family protein [Zhaonella formicivorans]|uniref:cytochrome c3 family protein n=1 Tax=Zhaonella formicivorans TaxID=2528593 RepID=UPI0010CED9AA|nr:cytochrome c3 family protein [Zhaonella formicivorans]